MAELGNYEVNIKAIKDKLSKSNQISIGDDFCLVDINIYDVNGGFGYPCRLDGNVMLFCVKGSLTLSVNLNEYKINAGEMVLCMVGDMVNAPIANDLQSEDCRVVMVTMSESFASELRIDFKKILDECVIPFETPVIKIDAETQDIMGDHMKLIAKMIVKEDSSYKISVRSLISSMMSIIAKCWLEEMKHLKTEFKQSSDNRNNRKRHLFEQFLKLISDNYTQQRQVGFYADILCLSPKYLSRLSKEVSGKSAPEWIDTFVLLEAKSLLKYSDMTIKEVVYRLNFSNQTVFYKYFKAHTGLTPTDYRNL